MDVVIAVVQLETEIALLAVVVHMHQSSLREVEPATPNGAV